MMDTYTTWSLPKQYLSAHYFLAEEKPMSITEAQRAQLGALHLYVSYGKYTEDLETPDLSLCSPVERKKRVDEWQKLSCLNKSNAMQKFMDLLTSLFPNWTRSRKLVYEFPLEWSSLEQTKTNKRPTPENLENNERGNEYPVGYVGLPEIPSPTKKKTTLISKNSYRRSSLGPIISSKRGRKGKQDTVTSKTSGKKQRNTNFNRTQSINLPNSLYSFKEVENMSPPVRFPIINDSVETYRKSLREGSNLKQFVENLQSYKAGNIHDTSATKFPKFCGKGELVDMEACDPPIDFNKELKCYRRGLLQEEFNKFKITAEPVSLQSEFNKLQEAITSLKLKVQKLID